MTDRADIEFHHSVFPNSIQQIALLGFPWFPVPKIMQSATYYSTQKVVYWGKLLLSDESK